MKFEGSLILLVIFLGVISIFGILYLIWIKCCYENLPSRSSSNSATPTTITVLPTSEKGLDVATINSLPILIHSNKKLTLSVGSGGGDGDGDGGCDDCSICLSRFEDMEMLKIMPNCKHAFHCVCLDTWLEKRSTCPLCRDNIVSISST